MIAERRRRPPRRHRSGLPAVDELTVKGYRAIYAAVGFDREVPPVEYWQDLSALNPGSTP